MQFLFLDDGSTDETWNVLKSLSGDNPERFLIRRLAQNIGKSEAFRQGLTQVLKVDADYVGY